jgi:hypothetical protein
MSHYTPSFYRHKCIFSFAAISIVTLLAAFASSARASGGKYLKIDYPASTNAGELQTAVTYTLWLPDNVKTFRGIIVHQHGAGTTASIEFPLR